MNRIHVRRSCISSLIVICTLCGMGFGVPAANPVPYVNAPLVPSAAVPGGPGFTLTVNGSGFVSNSIVNWNGSPRATKFLSESQVTAAISASDVATATTASVTVTNPAPGGGTSNTAYLTVTIPKAEAPFITSNNLIIGPGSGQVLIGDFNQDGKPDLAVLSAGGPSFIVLLGNGDGTFKPATRFPLPRFPIAAVVADFNGDGKADLAMTEANRAGQIEVLLGNGDGTFQPAQAFSTSPGIGGAIVAADINSDGHIDLISVQDNAICVLLGNGDGTFAPPLQIQGFTGPSWIGVGDWNRDGKLDLAVTNEGSASVSVLLGNGDGTFVPGVLLSTADFPQFISVGDFNNDNKLDLVINEGGQHPNSDLRVFLGNGDGSFQAGVVYATSTDLYEQVVTGDINGDGNLDLAVVACCGAHNADVAVLLGNGDGTFGPPDYHPLSTGPLFLAVADLNRDGSMDLVSSNGLPHRLSVLLQTPAIFSPGNLSFGTVAVGSSQVPRTTTLTNVGWGPLQLTGVSIKGTNAGDFSQTNDCPASLAQGASCTIDVTFTPTSDGARAATLRVADAGAPQLQGVTLKGTGTFAGLSPLSVNFGNQAVGTSSNPQTVTLTNLSSSTTLQSIKIALTGVNRADFSETSTCGSTLAAGANCAIKVTFTPHGAGSRGASLNVRATGASNPAPVPLRGTGD